jgi:amino acid adenylation domain-containing protein
MKDARKMGLEFDPEQANCRPVDEPGDVVEGPAPYETFVDWNTMYRPVLQTTLPRLFEQQVERTPDRPALAYGRKALCYADLNTSANQLAHRLIELRLGPEDIIGVALDRSPQMIIAVLAILKAGAAFFPIDPNYPEDRLGFIVGDANPAYIITNERLASRLPRQFPVLLIDEAATRSALMAYPAGNPGETDRRAPLTPLNAAYVVYTSGSTGLPKGVLVSHAGIPSLVCSLIDQLAVTPDFRVLQFVSSSFDVFLLDICLGLLAGGQLILAPAEEIIPGTPLESFANHTSFNHLNFPSAGLGMMSPAHLPECSSLFIGGDQCTAKVVDDWSWGRRMINSYGLSEVTVCSTVSDPLTGAVVPPIGRAIYNTQLYVLDAALQPVAIGITGELYIAGAGLARGYIGRPDLTAERFVACPFGPPGQRMYRTGDLVRWRTDGMLDFIGRNDYQVKVNGFRIELGEIESALRRHPGVREAVAVVREDTPRAQRLCAYVMPADPTLKDCDLRSFLKEKLPAFMLPTAIVFLDKFPLGPNGKINRKALPIPTNSEKDNDAPQSQQKTATEQALANIWHDLLGTNQVGLDDKFSQLGGNSFDMGRLISEVNQRLSVSINFSDVFKNPRLKDLAKIIDEKNKTDRRLPVVVPLRDSEDASQGIPIYFVCNGADQIRLAGLIKTGQPVYGIEAPFRMDWCKAGKNPDGSDLPTMEQLIAPFLEALHAHNGTAPCILAGFSFSGVMAFEIAQRLVTRGVTVTDVLLFDAFRQHPNQLALQELQQEREQFLRGNAKGRAIHWVTSYAKTASLVSFCVLYDKFRSLIRSMKGKRYYFFILDERGQVVPAKIVVPIFANAQRTSRPTRLDARGILFRASTHEKILDFVDDGLGWKNFFARGLEIISVPGDHLSMIRREDTSDLSRELNKVLSQTLHHPEGQTAQHGALGRNHAAAD